MNVRTTASGNSYRVDGSGNYMGLAKKRGSTPLPMRSSGGLPPVGFNYGGSVNPNNLEVRTLGNGQQ
jgi:hypothetical protein